MTRSVEMRMFNIRMLLVRDEKQGPDMNNVTMRHEVCRDIV